VARQAFDVEAVRARVGAAVDELVSG
jgi:hypothetical protein